MKRSNSEGAQGIGPVQRVRETDVAGAGAGVHRRGPGQHHRVGKVHRAARRRHRARQLDGVRAVDRDRPRAGAVDVARHHDVRRRWRNPAAQ